MHEIGTMFLDWLYPPHVACAFCGVEAQLNERDLCPACFAALKLAPNPPCPRELDGFFAGAVYQGTARTAIWRYKYNGCAYLAAPLAAFLTLPENWHGDALVPVPLWHKKERQRGYNQSALLARELSGRALCPVEQSWLHRIRDTGTQTNLDHDARTKNVKNAFQAAVAVRGKRIVLIDDVATTGATLNACARALRAAGAKAVFALTVFVTPK